MCDAYDKNEIYSVPASWRDPRIKENKKPVMNEEDGFSRRLGGERGQEVKKINRVSRRKRRSGSYLSLSEIQY